MPGAAGAMGNHRLMKCGTHWLTTLIMAVSTQQAKVTEVNVPARPRKNEIETRLTARLLCVDDGPHRLDAGTTQAPRLDVALCRWGGVRRGVCDHLISSSGLPLEA